MFAKSLFAAAFAAILGSAHAHTIIYAVSGSSSGLRAINNSNNPVQNVQSTDVICNAGNPGPVAARDVAPGTELYFQYQHNAPNDDIMDGSHLGPCMIYGSKDNGQNWAKLWHDGYNGGQWCTTKMIANKGIKWTVPSNFPSGKWVFRVEVIALHSASSSGGAQLYIRCMDVNITGNNSGSYSPTVKFPGAYKASDPGLLINIYPMSGSYIIPGGNVASLNGGGSSSGGNTGGNGGNNGGQTSPPPTTNNGNCASMYGQCGGKTYTGATCCSSGTCKSVNEYYSQCV